MSPLHPGFKLDHYAIEGLVARSGMASIYRAKDDRNGRVVALRKRSARSWIIPP